MGRIWPWVVDGNVEELPAGAAGFVLGIAGDAVSGPVDAGLLLDVDVHQVAGSGVLVAVGRQFGFEHADLVEPEPGEDAADGGAAEPGEPGDLNAGLALAPQPLDARGQFRRCATRRPMDNNRLKLHI